MRKWMRERLQRRKKTPAEPSGQHAPPPFQPAYAEADQETPTAAARSGPESDSAKSVPEVRPARRGRPALQDDQPRESVPEAQPAAPQPASRESSATGRGRRRRGGRGRGGRGREQAVAQAFAPAAVKGIPPDLPGQGIEAAEEGTPEKTA